MPTVPCSSGVGEPIPGIGPIVVYDVAKLVNLFTQRGLGWLANFLPQIGGQNWDLASFCSTGYTEPTHDAATIANFFNPTNPTGAADLNTWLVDWANVLVWETTCQCSIGTATTVTPDPQPTDLTTSPPDTTTSGNCHVGTATRLVNYTNNFAWNFNDTLPQNPGFSDGQFTVPQIPTPLPASLVLAVANGNQGALPYSVQVILDVYNASHTLISASTYASPNIAPGTTFTSPALPIPSNAAYWAVIAQPSGSNVGTPTNQLQVTSTIYCQGQGPNNLGMVCCPTDPNLMGLLQEILQRVEALYSIIPVRVPTYVQRNTAAGLSGHGTYTVADKSVIALRINTTTFPSVYGQVDSLPSTYLDLGWVTPVTSAGPEEGRRLTRSPQVVPLPEATTSLDYSLQPGQVVAITELLAG